MDAPVPRLVRILALGRHFRGRNGSAERHSRGMERYRGPAV